MTRPSEPRARRGMVLLALGLLAVLPAPAAAQLQARQTLAGHTGVVVSVAFSPDGKTLASGGWDQTIRLWDVATGKNSATFRGPATGVYSVAFSPDGKTLASGSQDKAVRLWDVKSGKITATFHGHTEVVHRVAFSADGKSVASWSQDRSIKLWDVATGKNITSFPGQTWSFWPMADSPDGRTQTWASQAKTVPLWDRAANKSLATLDGHTASVRAVAYSPDGKTLASASYDKTIKLWELKWFPVLGSAAAKEVVEKGLKAIAVSPGAARDDPARFKQLVAELGKRYLAVPAAEQIRLLHFSRAIREVLSGAKKHDLFFNKGGGFEDTMLTEILKEFGRANKPKVLDRASMDDLKKKGWTIFYRGVREKKFTEQFRSGPPYSGSGYYGNGTYAQKVMREGPAGEEAAKKEAKQYGSHVLRIALPPKAKVISYSQLRQDLTAYQTGLRNDQARGAITKADFDNLIAITNDAGRFAALHHYDAIQGSASGYFVLLNRTILAVEDKDQ